MSKARVHSYMDWFEATCEICGYIGRYGTEEAAAAIAQGHDHDYHK